MYFEIPAYAYIAVSVQQKEETAHEKHIDNFYDTNFNSLFDKQ